MRQRIAARVIIGKSECEREREREREREHKNQKESERQADIQTDGSVKGNIHGGRDTITSGTPLGLSLPLATCIKRSRV